MELFLALSYFTALTAAFLWKLFAVWNTSIPGGLEDTRLFLWNAWWFHYAITVLHTNPFHTSMLFHPFGTSLISHDFPMCMNLITFAGQELGLSMIASSNVWFALSWMLLGFCTYGLVREVTGKSSVAIVAGTFAMTNSYTLARAMQNWGQFNSYGIALFLWLLIRARKQSGKTLFIAAGAALAWTAACHYYFLIYSVLIWLVLVVRDLCPYSIRVGWRWDYPGYSRAILRVLSTLAVLIALGIWFHPMILHIGEITLGLESPENALFVMWVLILTWGMTYMKLSFPAVVGGESIMTHGSPTKAFGDDKKIRLRNHLVLGITAMCLLSPLFWATFQLLRHGGYPKQSILWKTHNRGADFLALPSPNPLHVLWGPAVSRWFWAHNLIPTDMAASLGWICMGLILWSKVWKDNSSARRWLGLAIAATILAMGTHFRIADVNFWCPLPFFVFRLLPILGNVRVPERWMAVGAIAWSVVLALALTRLAVMRGWSLRKMSVIVTALILLENWPGLPFLEPPALSSIYTHLKEMPPGAVLTIPLYIGDSSIGTGGSIGPTYAIPWDYLWFQTAHEKPLVGGYIGRISRSLIDKYKTDPFIHTLLDLEDNKIQAHEPDPAFGDYAVTNMNFKYVLVYPECTDPEALKYAMGSLPLEPVDISTGPVHLYQIRADRSD